MDTQWGDGIKVDVNGFIYITAKNGLSIFSQQGELLKNIAIRPINCSNCCWGSTLAKPEMYITSVDAVYRISNKLKISILWNNDPIKTFCTCLLFQI